MDGPFAGQTAIVSGAGSGLGAAIACALAAGGAHAVLAGRRPDALAVTADRIRAAGGQATPVPTDVTQWDEVLPRPRLMNSRLRFSSHAMCDTSFLRKARCAAICSSTSAIRSRMNSTIWSKVSVPAR